MSHKPTGTVGVRDASIAIPNRYDAVVQEGPAYRSYNVVSADDGTNTSSAAWTIRAPSVNMGTSRYLPLRAVGTITVTGTNLNNAANCQFALRDWPLASCMSNLTCNVDQANITVQQPQQMIAAYARVANPTRLQKTTQSGSSTAPDVGSRYVDVANTAASPFGSGFDAVSGDGVAAVRTAQITSMNFAAGGTSVTIGFDITEPLIISPFVSDSSNPEALFGVNTIQINASWTSLHHMLSAALFNNATITGVTVAFTRQDLQVCYVTPSTKSLTSKDITAHYSCSDFRYYSIQQGALAVPATGSANISSQAVSVCPRQIIIWASLPVSEAFTSPVTAPQTADVFLPITNLSINLYDKSGLLAGATPQQLYALSLQSGLKATMAEFLGSPVFQARGSATTGANLTPDGFYAGAPIVLDVASLLSLPDHIAPGSLEATQFTVQATVSTANLAASNNSAAHAALQSYNLNLLLVTDATLICSGGSSVYSQLALTPAEIMHAREGSELTSLTVNRLRLEATLSGGSFGSELRDFGKGFVKGFRMVVDPAVKYGLPLALKAIGAGGAEMNRKEAKSLMASLRGYK